MNSETQDLIDRYVDGLATSEEVRRVDELVRHDPTVRHALLMAAGMHLDLQRLLTRTPDDVRPTPRPAGRRTSPMTWRAIASHAAVCLVALTGWIAAIAFAARYQIKCGEYATAVRTIGDIESFKHRISEREEQAKQAAAGSFVQTRGLVLVLPEGQGQAVPVSVGLAVPTGRSLWTCPWGAAAMRFADGVSVDLDRSTVAAVSESNGVRRIALKQGIVFVTQLGASRDREMVVTTKNGSVAVTNAQVAVTVGARGTVIEVAQGQVRFTRKPDEPGVTISAGQYAIAGTGVEPRALDGRLAWSLEPTK